VKRLFPDGKNPLCSLKINGFHGLWEWDLNPRNSGVRPGDRQWEERVFQVGLVQNCGGLFDHIRMLWGKVMAFGPVL
jgi:hypothetical protein